MLKHETITLLATVAAYMLAAARLFNVAKPLYGWIPAKLQPVAIALAAGLPQLAEALIGSTTKEQVLAAVGSAVVAFLVSVKGAPPAPPGDSSPVAVVPLSVRPPGGMDAEFRAWCPLLQLLPLGGAALACLVGLVLVACGAPLPDPCSRVSLATITAGCEVRIKAECEAGDESCPAYVECSKAVESWRGCR